MKNSIIFGLALLLNILVTFSANASLVNIPDANFRAYLQATYPGCFTGQLMETSCSEVVNATTINVANKGIANLSGIEYFVNLNMLVCNNNILSTLPALPPSITYLECSYNQITSLPVLPTGLINFYCYNNQLTSLPSLPSSLNSFACRYNQLTSLPPLPSSLFNIDCSNNQLTSLPSLNLPILYQVICSNNQLTTLPALSNSITYLYSNFNNINVLPALPTSLVYFECHHNQLTSFPVLPSKLSYLFCNDNLFNSLPSLPASLTYLACFNNQLTSLPVLPSLQVLNCYSNQLPSLPGLPASLTYLACNNNLLTSLPSLPAALAELDCQNNQLNILPFLPNTLCTLYCTGNNFTCLPNIPTCSTFYSSCGRNVKPVASAITGPVSLCENAMGVTYSVSAVAGSTFTWTVPAGATIVSGSGTASINVNFGTTSGSVSVIQTLSSGCSSDPSVIQVILNPKPPVTLTSSSTTICYGTTVALTAAGANTYVWTASAGLVVNAANPSLATAKPLVTKSYTVTGTNTYGCSKSASVSITVNALPVISITPPSATICKGSSVSLTASGADTYVWTGSPFTGSGSTIIANPIVNRTYTVTGTNPEGCTAKKSVVVTVSTVAVPVITPDCNSLTVSSVAGLTYQWNLNGTPVAGATSNTYNPAVCGSYSLTANNSFGCFASAAPYYVVGTSSSSALRAGVSNTVDNNGTGFSVYPNPNNGSFAMIAEAKVRVIDIQGKVVYEKNVTDLNELKNIDSEVTASGTYIVQLMIGETLISKKMLVVQ
jgi:Leucine-rich repeat (LRR) protein